MYTQCGLPNPEPHVGPQPGGNGNGEVPPEMLGPFGPFVHTAGNIIPGIPFATQHIVVYNTSLGGAFPPEDMTVKVWYDWNGSTFTSSQTFTGIVPPDAMPYEVGSVTQTLPSGPGVYDIEVLGVATNTMNAGAINYWTEIWSGPSGYPTIP
ncbi:MAG: hypothetical protein AMJ43_05530 [Coxiella sp. DG_40]|nr:MAG: hypothetical protein AMJ43_05530 [Coxiella sp. DG_40]